MSDLQSCRGAAPILVVSDLARASAALEALGFRRLDLFAGNDEYVPLDRAGAQVHLMAGERADPNNARGSHVADVFVWTDELDPVVAAAQDAGFPITRGPEHYASRPVATSEVVVEVPEGYWICFATAEAG